MIPMNSYEPVGVNYAHLTNSAIWVTELIVFVVAWVAREQYWFKEREMLLDRLMSKDVREFKAISTKKPVAARNYSMLDDEALADLEEKQKSEIARGL
jgi:hypothetical protein